MRGVGASHRLGVVLVAVAFAACTGAQPASPVPSPSTGLPISSPSSATPSAPSGSALVVCPPATGTTGAPAEPRQWPGRNRPAGLSEAADAEFTELEAAIGNPDTGSRSPAWDAFESALKNGDSATIRTAADAVIGHLRAACAALATYLDLPGAGSWAVDVRGLHDKLAQAVAAMRDAAVGHDQAGLEAARSLMQTALLDHFYQSMKMSDPEVYRVHLRTSPWSATASHLRWITNEVGRAFDGDATTMWLAGQVATPQWLEVDFGAELSIASVRLQVYQEAAGASDHRVTVRTAAGTETELVRFTGDTTDKQWLEYAAPAPVTGVRYVRVTTLATPSMVGWREVEVGVAQGSTPGPCPSTTTARTDVAKTMAMPSTGASDPAFAVDGNVATGWDPGPVRGVDGARGWIRVWYGSQIRISEVRVLLGPGSPAARYEVVVFPPGELGNGLGMLGPIPAGGGWVSLTGPNPCLPYESVYIWVRSTEPAGTIHEIQVIGTAAG